MAGLKAKLTCSAGETGNSQVTVTTGKLKGTSSSFSGSCASPDLARMTATIKWKATGGKVAPTTITWNRAFNNTQPYEHFFETATITGSYAAQDSVADFVGSMSQDACAVKPLKRWPFRGNSFEILTGGGGGGGGGGCGPIATASAQTDGSKGNIWIGVAPTSLA